MQTHHDSPRNVPITRSAGPRGLRWGIRQREVTKRSYHTPKDFPKLALEFHQLVWSVASAHHIAIEDVWNIDETAVVITPGHGKTLADKGSKEVAGITAKMLSPANCPLIPPPMPQIEIFEETSMDGDVDEDETVRNPVEGDENEENVDDNEDETVNE